MGMLSISIRRARTAVFALLLAGCSASVPWSKEPIGSEVNLSFTFENNLLFLSTATIDGRVGRYFFGSAHQRSVVDPRVGLTSGAATVQLSEKDQTRITPVTLDLHGVGDAIIGADAWSKYAVTVDYHSGLVTMQKQGIHPAYMTIFRYTAEPSVTLRVDDRDVVAIVDTALPDTVVLPHAGAASRGNAHVALAGTDFGTLDVRYDNVTRARVGNRVLSKFLITIDYGRRVVGVWRDPRIAM